MEWKDHYQSLSIMTVITEMHLLNAEIPLAVTKRKAFSSFSETLVQKFVVSSHVFLNIKRGTPISKVTRPRYVQITRTQKTILSGFIIKKAKQQCRLLPAVHFPTI